MDPATLSSEIQSHTNIPRLLIVIILKAHWSIAGLLKTNRPPTDQEKAIVQKSMAPTNEKFRDVRGQISDTVAHIEALRLQVQQAERKLQRLLEDEAAILKTSEDHRRVLSAIRTLPEDVLREICIACVEYPKLPNLSYHTIPLPYVLARISRGMRRIALTTPVIWASMEVQIRHKNYYSDRILNEQAYKALSRRATEWFASIRRLPLTLSIKNPDDGAYRRNPLASHPSDILLGTILSYSKRWKNIKFETCEDLSMPLVRIFALQLMMSPCSNPLPFILILHSHLPSFPMSRSSNYRLSDRYH